MSSPLLPVIQVICLFFVDAAHDLVHIYFEHLIVFHDLAIV